MTDPSLLVRFEFEGRIFRVVATGNPPYTIERLLGIDAMGEETWRVPCRDVSGELAEDLSGLLGAAVEAALRDVGAQP